MIAKAPSPAKPATSRHAATLRSTVAELLDMLSPLGDPELLMEDGGDSYRVAPDCEELLAGLLAYLRPRIARVDSLVLDLLPEDIPAGAEAVQRHLHIAGLALASLVSGDGKSGVDVESSLYIASEAIKAAGDVVEPRDESEKGGRS